MVSTPLAAIGIDRVVAIIWGICTERYTAGNSLESSRHHVNHFCPSLPGITPGLKDHRYSSVPGVTPGLKDYLCRLLGNLYLVLHRWEFPGIAPQSSWNTAGHPSGITPGLEDHLAVVLLGISGTPLTLRQDRRRPSLAIPD